MKPKKKHPKGVWADGMRFPVIQDAGRKTSCNVELGAKPDATTKKFRAEIARREKRLQRERAKFPPTGIYVGKGKKRRYTSNPKFTTAMSAKLHKLAFTAEQVRTEVTKG